MCIYFFCSCVSVALLLLFITVELLLMIIGIELMICCHLLNKPYSRYLPSSCAPCISHSFFLFCVHGALVLIGWLLFLFLLLFDLIRATRFSRSGKARNQFQTTIFLRNEPNLMWFILILLECVDHMKWKLRVKLIQFPYININVQNFILFKSIFYKI